MSNSLNINIGNNSVNNAEKPKRTPLPSGPIPRGLAMDNLLQQEPPQGRPSVKDQMEGVVTPGNPPQPQARMMPSIQSLLQPPISTPLDDNESDNPEDLAIEEGADQNLAQWQTHQQEPHESGTKTYGQTAEF
ncbi:hypothetical protein EG329_006417 [Mollisiaceae sp. DMI_Dod_QoI]|nr:hypothetical protein EG329_006417 [Helotiales sp. DMI_Dod_QoI]